MVHPWIRVYTRPDLAEPWLQRFQGARPRLAVVLGFTETGLLPGISAAGATPEDRRYTALADAEFLYAGPQAQTRFPLPPLQAGASPTLISRAVVMGQDIPFDLINAGLWQSPTVPCIDLGGLPAGCVSTGAALPLPRVQHLWQQGWQWGLSLAEQMQDGYLVVGECVVGGTTTALAVLLGLGYPASGQVNSSHPVCNHAQKRAVVEQGLAQWWTQSDRHPLALVSAVGDPMQPVVAAMAMAASQRVGVLLAGGTQMLAVYGLMQAMAQAENLDWQAERVVVGTTRWVAEDTTGDTVGLANCLQAPLIATRLSFATARYPQLQAYERGFVKEGVAAGGCAIASHLYGGWAPAHLMAAVENLFAAQLTLAALPS